MVDVVTLAAVTKAAPPVGSVITAARDPGPDYIKLDGRSVSLAAYPALADLKPLIGTYGVANDVQVPLGGKGITNMQMVYFDQWGVRLYVQAGKLYRWDEASRTIQKCDLGGGDDAWDATDYLFGWQSDATGRVMFSFNGSNNTSSNNEVWLSEDGGRTFVKDAALNNFSNTLWNLSGSSYALFLGAPGQFVRLKYTGSEGRFTMEETTDGGVTWEFFSTVLAAVTTLSSVSGVFAVYQPSSARIHVALRYYASSTYTVDLGFVESSGQWVRSGSHSNRSLQALTVVGQHIVIVLGQSTNAWMVRVLPNGTHGSPVSVSYSPGAVGFASASIYGLANSLNLMSVIADRFLVWCDTSGAGLLDVTTAAVEYKGSFGTSISPVATNQHTPLIYSKGRGLAVWVSFARNSLGDADARENVAVFKDMFTETGTWQLNPFNRPYVKRFGCWNTMDAWFEDDGSLVLIDANTSFKLRYAYPYIENQSVYSEAFDTAAYTLTSATVLPDRAGNPLDGARTADEFIENTASGEHRIQFPGFPGRTTNEPFTVSFFIKKNSGLKNVVRVSAWVNYAHANIDLDTGVVSGLYKHSYISTFTMVTEDMSDGWWRVVATVAVTTSLSGGTCDPGVQTLNNAGTGTSFVGDGASGFYLFGLLYVEGAQADPIYVKSGETPHATGGRVTGPASIAPAIVGPTNYAFGAAQGALYLDVRGVLYRSDDGLTYDYIRWLGEDPDGTHSYGLLGPLWVGEDHLGRLAVVETGGNKLSLLDGAGRVVATSMSVVVGTNYQYVQALSDRRHLWAVNKSGARYIYKFDLETLTNLNIDLYYFFQTSTTGIWYPNVRQIAVDDTYLYAVFSFSNDAAARELWRVPLASLVTTTSGGPQGQGAAMGWVRLIDFGADPDAMACGNGVLVIAHDNDLFYSDDGGATIERATVSEIVTPGFHTITSLQYEAATATWLACGKHFMAVSGDGKTWQRAETEPDISYGAGGIVGGLAVAFDTETGRGGRMFELVDNTTEVLVPTMPHEVPGLAYYMKGR